MKPVNKNATDKAKRLLSYLYETAGNRLITGQHTQTNLMEEREYIREVTGRYPKLLGFELLSYSPNIDRINSSEECLTEVRENEGTLKTALHIAKTTDAILTFCFHWFSPVGGSDKAFYTKNTDFDAARVLVDGSAEQAAFDSDLDVIAKKLSVFRDGDIPILWRPFHEVEGTWFWWGAKGGEVAARLYRRMYNKFVNEYRLDNLLWVWSSPTAESYPGDEYVDVIGWDIYLPEKSATDYREHYDKLIAATTKNKVAAITEVSYNPDAALIEKSRVPWAYFMTWSKEFIVGEKYNTKEELRTLYGSDYTAKL